MDYRRKISVWSVSSLSYGKNMKKKTRKKRKNSPPDTLGVLPANPTLSFLLSFLSSWSVSSSSSSSSVITSSSSAIYDKFIKHCTIFYLILEPFYQIIIIIYTKYHHQPIESENTHQMPKLTESCKNKPVRSRQVDLTGPPFEGIEWREDLHRAALIAFH